MESGLVALNDIRPGNGVGLFLQPRSPHRATSQGSVATVLGEMGTFIFFHCRVSS